MNLVNQSANIQKYATEKEWAKDMRKGLKRDLKIYQKQCSDKPLHTDIDKYLEGVYVSDFIDWFLNNYFD